MDILHHRFKNFFDVFELYDGLFHIIASYDYAFAVFDISRTHFDSYRNSAYFVFGELPSGAVVAVVELGSEFILESVIEGGICFKNSILMHSDGNNDNLNGSYSRSHGS